MSKSTTPITTAKLLAVGAFLLVTSTASAQFACINGLSPSTLSYSSSGGSSTTSLSVKAAECSWRVSASPFWLTVNPSSGMGAKTITITCTANYGGVRSGTVSFTDGVGTKSLTVQQACSIPYTPSGPIYGDTNPCHGSTQSYYISKIQAPGASSYSWTVPPEASIISGQGTRSISVLIGSTSGSVSVTAVNACGSSPSISLAVTVNDPSQATGKNGSRCNAGTVTLTATPGLLANSIRWYNAPAGGTLLATGTSYTTPPISTTTTYYAASYSTATGCEASVRSAIRAVISYTLAQPGTISGPDSVCQGDTHGYSIDPVSDATDYTWRLGSTVTYSGIKNMALISFSTVGSQTVSVTANNSCGASAARNLSVLVSKIPSQPGAISGPDSVCQRTSCTYSITPVSGATGYTWSVTGGALTSEQGKASVTIHFSAVGSQTVSVTANNYCGSSVARTLGVLVIGIPSQPGTINGSDAVCQGTTQAYSITPVSGATTYTWSVTGGTITSGQRALSSKISFNAVGSQTVSVTAGNSCGSSTPKTLSVLVSGVLPQPGTISGSDSVCQEDTRAYDIAPVSGATAYTWRLGSTVTYSGIKNMAQISFSTVGSQMVSVTADNGCGASAARTLGVSVNGEPPQPGTISGPSAVSQEISYQYSVAAVSGATTYTWSVTGGTVTSGQGTASPRISFNTAGSQAVSVKAENSCGSSVPRTLGVTVKTLVNLTTRSNYVYTMRLNTPVGTSQIIESLWDKDVARSVAYFDGLGRPAQSVSITSSPTHKDVVQPIVYDGFNRERVKYLPYTGGSEGAYNASAVADQLSFYSNTALTGLPGAELNPYAEAVFESSPLNRVLEQGAAGSTWQPTDKSGSSAGHTTKLVYAYNAQHNVLQLAVDEARRLVNSRGELSGSLRYYPANRLYKTVTKNENWQAADGTLNTTEEFKDKQGQVVLKRTYVKDDQGATVPVSTYYAYDDLNLLRYVIPPAAVGSIAFPASKESSVVKSLCYYYRYDGRKRMTVKQLPGADSVCMVYDQRDRLVLTQDGNMRSGNRWLFTLYDALNRPVMTGEKEIAGKTHDQLRTYFENYSGVETLTSGGVGYTTTSISPIVGSITDTELLTVTYYDGYGFMGTVSGFSGLGFRPEYDIDTYSDTEGNPRYFEQVRGQVAGTLQKVLNGNEHTSTAKRLCSVTYYDDRYRPIQSVGNLYDGISGDYQVASTRYHFNGQVEKTKEVKRFNGVTDSVMTRLSYDHAWRLTKKELKVNNATSYTTLAELAYNELGQLADKKLGGGLQSVDYRYNVRGWLTDINNPSNLAAAANNDSKDDLFAMRLNYNSSTPVAGFTPTPQYNGNISGVIVNRRDNNGSTSTTSGYGFTYDALNRLTSSSYGEGGNFTTNKGKYKESGIAYDLNGNILWLNRKNSLGVAGVMDSLDYKYSGNRLQKVTDISGKTAGFNDSNVSGDDYAYDANGNLKKDLNKGITSISYNLLNLPSVLSKDGSNGIKYTYGATGVKLCKEVTVSDVTSKRYYAGSFEYDNAKELVLIHHEEGMVEVSGGTSFSYEYYLKDHLGNTRIVFNGTGGVLQRNDYYPFGMTANQYSSSTDNKYLFAGKELQDDQIGGVSLNLIDFGARFYDPELGRFTTIDPLAEKYRFQTSYAYAANNPILLIDFMGMGPDSTNTSAFLDAFDQRMQQWANHIFSILKDPDNLNPILQQIYDDPGGTVDQVVDDAVQTVDNLANGTPAQQGNAAANVLTIFATAELFNGSTTGKATTTEGALLKPYGGPGGGHHVPAKSAFVGAPGYDANAALAIPNTEMARLGVSHSAVTGAQMTGYQSLARSGNALTWGNVATIETNALVRGGMNTLQAQATVNQAINTLKNAGVANPTRIPWGVVKLK